MYATTIETANGSQFDVAFDSEDDFSLFTAYVNDPDTSYRSPHPGEIVEVI
jgi:hypothetical protein